MNCKDKNNFMYKHMINEHEGKLENASFEWKVVNKYVKPLSRQLAEAINIEHQSMKGSLNSKSEFYRHNIQRVKMNSKEFEFQCKHC